MQDPYHDRDYHRLERDGVHNLDNSTDDANDRNPKNRVKIRPSLFTTNLLRMAVVTWSFCAKHPEHMQMDFTIASGKRSAVEVVQMPQQDLAILLRSLGSLPPTNHGYHQQYL